MIAASGKQLQSELVAKDPSGNALPHHFGFCILRASRSAIVVSSVYWISVESKLRLLARFKTESNTAATTIAKPVEANAQSLPTARRLEGAASPNDFEGHSHTH